MIFEDALEAVDVIKVFDRIGWLGAHPFVLDQRIDYLAEIAGRPDVPAIEYQFREPAPFFQGQFLQTFAKDLTTDVLGFTDQML